MKSRVPRPSVGLAVLCGILLATSLLASSPTSAGDGAATAKEIEAAGALFRGSCTACHLPPDPDHGTDRAWLKQVTDTA